MNKFLLAKTKNMKKNNTRYKNAIKLQIPSLPYNVIHNLGT